MSPSILGAFCPDWSDEGSHFILSLGFVSETKARIRKRSLKGLANTLPHHLRAWDDIGMEIDKLALSLNEQIQQRRQLKLQTHELCMKEHVLRKETDYE